MTVELLKKSQCKKNEYAMMIKNSELLRGAYIMVFLMAAAALLTALILLLISADVAEDNFEN